VAACRVAVMTVMTMNMNGRQ